MTKGEIQEGFAAHLRIKVREHYHDRIPSAATFAMHFNLRCPDHSTGISDETARRWLRGTSLPDALHKQVLVTWLGLDLHQALGCPERAAAKSAKDLILQEFLSLLPSLSPEKRRAFLDLLKVSVEPPSEPAKTDTRRAF